MSRTALGHLGWRRPSGSHAPSGAQPNLADIIAARKRIRGMAALTPLRPSDAMSRHCGAPVYFKLETMQPTGAFKVRGAANHILSLSADQRRAGVITVSTGNHGRAVAYVACALAIRCVVCLSSLVPANKIAAIEALGAEVDVGGADQDAAMERAIARACAEGMTLVPPFDHPAVIAGQGTIGLEIAEDLLPVGTVIAPLSGGGLIGGIAAALKPIDPRIRVVAIASERCPAMLESLKAGWPVMVEERSSLADLLGGGIGLENAYSFPLVRDLVDEVWVVGEDATADAIRLAFIHERLVLEGAAATGIAALIQAPAGTFPGPIVVVVTGDNIDRRTWLAIINDGNNRA